MYTKQVHVHACTCILSKYIHVLNVDQVGPQPFSLVILTLM